MMEIERQKKVLNMMITAHSVLAGSYFRRSSFTEVLLLVTSAVLNALVIADPVFIKSTTSLDEGTQKAIIAIASVTVFAISVILLQVKWKEKAEEHQKSSDQLFILLQDCRPIVQLEDSEQKQIQISEFHKKYNQVSSFLAKIPENEFNL